MKYFFLFCVIRCFEDKDEGKKQSLESSCIMFCVLWAFSLSANSHKTWGFFFVFNKKIVCGIVWSNLSWLILCWELWSSHTKPSNKWNQCLHTLLWLSHWSLPLHSGALVLKNVFLHNIFNFFLLIVWIVICVIRIFCFV